jgi:hypothetical protein
VNKKNVQEEIGTQARSRNGTGRGRLIQFRFFIFAFQLGFRESEIGIYNSLLLSDEPTCDVSQSGTDENKCCGKETNTSSIDGYLHPFWILSTAVSTKFVCWLVQKMI